jgi:hypothetical protein
MFRPSHGVIFRSWNYSSNKSQMVNVYLPGSIRYRLQSTFNRVDINPVIQGRYVLQFSALGSYACFYFCGNWLVQLLIGVAMLTGLLIYFYYA